MKKKLLTGMLSAIMVSSLATNVMGASQKTEMTITHPETGVTEGYCYEKMDSKNTARDTYVDFVGIGSDDIGPWEHGVVLSGASGTVYSNYTNPSYWHGSSVTGSGGTKRSTLVKPGSKSKASVKTMWIDGNRSFWRVDENK